MAAVLKWLTWLTLVSLLFIFVYINPFKNQVEAVIQPDERVSLALVPRDKPVLIFLWAEWCSVCHQAFHNLSELAARFPHQVYAWNVSGLDRNQLQKQLQLQPIPFSSLLSVEGFPAYAPRGVPTFLLIQKNSIVSVKEGPANRDELLAWLENP